MRDDTVLRTCAEAFGITLNPVQREQFDDYYTLLTEYNSVMNLTAITEYEEVCRLHFGDALSLLPLLSGIEFPQKDSPRLLDVGSGAGFPGIPLKIACPWLSVTLLDAREKRVSFLQTVIARLGLDACEDGIEAEDRKAGQEHASPSPVRRSASICAVHGRAEQFGAPGAEAREAFDLVVSRAVASLDVLSELCLPFVKQGGLFAAYKSGDIAEETRAAATAIRVLGGGEAGLHYFTLPETEIGRSIVLIGKRTPTPDKYPRREGIPAKKPIR